MQYFVPEENREDFIAGLKSNRLESNISVVRRKAIWQGRDPDLAERLYRAKVLQNMQIERSQ